jgi:hypothetical protein
MSDAAPTPTLQVDVTDVRGYPDTLAADLDRADADAADRCALDVDTDRHRVTVTAEDATAARWLYEWLEESVEYYREEFVDASGEHDAARTLASAVYEELNDEW